MVSHPGLKEGWQISEPSFSSGICEQLPPIPHLEKWSKLSLPRVQILSGSFFGKHSAAFIYKVWTYYEELHISPDVFLGPFI